MLQLVPFVSACVGYCRLRHLISFCVCVCVFACVCHVFLFLWVRRDSMMALNHERVCPAKIRLLQPTLNFSQKKQKQQNKKNKN